MEMTKIRIAVFTLCFHIKYCWLFEFLDKIPYGARCNFEQDWCGWYNAHGKILQWTRHNGTTSINKTGPSFDHTYRNSTGINNLLFKLAKGEFLDISGKYLHVTVETGRDAVFASTATLKSVVFNPPPRVHGNYSSKYYNSCTVSYCCTFLYQCNN